MSAPDRLTKPSVVHDPWNDRVLVYGGESAQGLTGRLLSIEPGRARLLDVTPVDAFGAPPPAAAAALLRDPVRRSISVIGGDATVPPNRGFYVPSRDLLNTPTWAALDDGT